MPLLSIYKGGFVLVVESALFAGFGAALGIRYGHAGAANRQYRLFAGLGVGVWGKRLWHAAAVDGIWSLAVWLMGEHLQDALRDEQAAQTARKKES